MKKNHTAEHQRASCLCAETDALYHQASLRLGISDSESIVLYAAHVCQGTCALGYIIKNYGISKQTLHSAVRKLADQGLLELQPCGGREKQVVLTVAGQEYARNTAGRLLEAEIAAFDTWTDEEIATYLRLMEKYVDCLRQQVEKL